MTDDIAKRFAADTAHHKMTVLHDDGLYRHLRFRHPQNGFYWFDLVTWPGVLVINGDMGSYTFSRVEDMFTFFRPGGGRINPSYWAEKVPHGMRTKEYSCELLAQLVAEYIEGAARELPGLVADVKTEILDHDYSGYEAGAHQLLADYRYYVKPEDRYGSGQPDFEFSDTWEWDLTDYSYQFLWCCHAIVWGIGQYDAKAAPAVENVMAAL